MVGGGTRIALCGAILALAGTPAHADTLRDALASAYNTNPTLQAARASQRGVDEDVVIQRAAGLPRLMGEASYSEVLDDTYSDPGNLYPNRQASGTLSLSVPVYSGGAVRNSVRAAKTRVKAGQADLRATESSVFSQVTAAYMDVILNEALVGLNANLVKVLSVNLQATSDRFEIGDLTRTDVAQSSARLELAKGDWRTAQANLVESRERYIKLVGHAPGSLTPPPPLPNMPATPDEAAAIALQFNPDLIAAQERAQAAGYDIKVAGSGRLPTVELFTQGNVTDTLGSGSLAVGTGGGSGIDRTTSATAGVRATIPLYQGGRPAAQERQAQAGAAAALEQQIAIERDVIAQVRAAYSSWQAAHAIIDSTQTAVSAAELSLEGVQAENTVGNRTILDILNAEQELRNARVQLVTAQRNAYVAGFTLLAAMGKAEARDLDLDTGGPLYDPQDNYRRVKGKYLDWGSDPAPVAQSTRTVDSPAQDGEISGAR
jgi:outer membrane protein